MKFSKHKPALPLFTTEDAEHAVRHLKPIDYDKTHGAFRRDPASGLWMPGTSSVPPSWKQTSRATARTVRMVFSGDLGRYDALILRDPTPVEYADYLLVESTYGNRQHAPEEPVEALASIINETARRGGMLVIPSFAVGRTQTLLYLLRDMRLRGVIPDLPIFVDSPMAQRVTDVFCRHIDIFDEEAKAVFRKTGKCPILSPNLQFVHSKEESQKINDMRFPAIILSASGMATGGRILHHLKYRLPDPRNTILFVGYQVGRHTRPAAAGRRARNQNPRRNGAGAGADPEHRGLFGTCGFHGDHALAALVQAAAQNDLCRPRRR